jgi:succinate dehydrogenase / fumarate reductase membrane anchor subunit
MMSLRSPLGRARGLGSAKEGPGHWWHQRLTAVALVPLAFWFVVSVLSLAGGSYEQFHAWAAVPGNAALTILLVGTVFHHAQLGLQVVIEDYVHGKAAKTASIVAVKLMAVLLAVFSAVAVLRAGLVGG